MVVAALNGEKSQVLGVKGGFKVTFSENEQNFLKDAKSKTQRPDIKETHALVFPQALRRCMRVFYSAIK